MNAHGIVHKYGDHVDTDVIIPARYLNTQSHKELASHCMEDIDASFAGRVKPGEIMVAGRNFGCGSSREHAPLAIKTCGVACVIAATFARIFYRNSINTGLAIMYNGRRILSRNGLVDLLNDTMTTDGLYPIIHAKGEDIEIAFTHTDQYGEEYHSFVNGQHTTQGGTHQSAFKEHIARTIKEFFNKNYEFGDIRNGLVAAIAINVEEPMFESQTKIKLGSLQMAPGGESINKYVGDFIKREIDNFLHIHPDVAEVMKQKIEESEKERKAMAGVTKLARERAKKANLHNRKLRDCRIHFSDVKDDYMENRVKGMLGVYYKPMQFVYTLQGTDCLQARMPFDPNLR